MEIEQKEQILISLRELYRRNVKDRDTIVEYANHFKAQNKFLAKQFSFLVQRLRRHRISFDETLFRSVLAEPLLTIELVPRTCWFSNVRDHVDKETWDTLRRATYKKAGYCCEVCGGKGDKWPVECHEIWHYDDANRNQILKGLLALCPACHEVKHIGFATVNGREMEAEAHLAEVNAWDEETTGEYVEKAWSVWSERSEHEWTLDFSWLKEQEINIQSKR